MSISIGSYIPRIGRPDLTPAARRSALRQLFYAGRRREPYRIRFVVMLSFAVSIASFGLLANQMIIVLSAMLLSPLMIPVLAAATALVLGWTRQLVRTLALIAFGAGWVVGLAYLIGTISPELAAYPEALLSMTNPTLFDLVVALLAGAASAYALVHSDVETLPGAAVAVSLLPPLAAAGLMLSSGEYGLAFNAFWLFFTNLVAIILAAGGVLFFMGFTPKLMMRRNQEKIRLGFILASIAVVIVAIPLAFHSATLLTESRERSDVEHAVGQWLDTAAEEFDVLAIRIDDRDVEIDLIGPHEPVGVIALSTTIVDRLGPDTTVDIRWIQRNDLRLR